MQVYKASHLNGERRMKQNITLDPKVLNWCKEQAQETRRSVSGFIEITLLAAMNKD